MKKGIANIGNAFICARNQQLFLDVISLICRG